MLGVYRKKSADDVFDTSEEALPLSLQRIAVEELGETPSKRKEALEKLTKLVSGKVLYLFYSGLDWVAYTCHWNPEEITYTTLQQAFIMCLEQVISDPVAQTAGIVIMADYLGLTIDKVFSMSLGLIRRLLEYFQDCMPARLKAVHILNQPYAFDVLFGVVKVFIKSKMAERMQMHGENYERFHEEVCPSTLPKEYGGHGPQFDFDAFWRLVDAQEDTFASGNRFGYVMLDDPEIYEDDQMPLQLTTL
nr:retinaldehyde-binding protein 1-like [Dermacentor andersoni]